MTKLNEFMSDDDAQYGTSKRKTRLYKTRAVMFDDEYRFGIIEAILYSRKRSCR